MKQNRMSVSQGATIFTEGERGDTMYVIVEGRVQILRKGSKSPVVLATLQPGSFFGEMAVVDQADRTATAVALTDVSLLAVHASELELLLAQRPDVGAKMIRTLVRRLKHTTNQVMDEKEKIAMLFDSGAESRTI